ncbi:glycosyltransferase family 1 protein [Latilactobacillus curvatus]|uniref:glycosyltransferase n=1 Tax=Latilactobacillus TaxID=2767885 RepID=UPI0009785D3C|nr:MULTISPECIES: glycosyltransferase [Latilactobacillus]MCT3524977.1 glycosyltransferase family 1 protein [Latilactobacillus curvatus]UTB70915.1 hypothetical protein A4W71_07445 [Latilactobacillus curvatus]UTB73809.1 hypothetical protein A4W73_02665 [Latilactobacillus curvatus]UTY79711.1 hypothetical protein A4W76_02685 [Latilactobacillus curvatus]SOB39873.1 conserved hypothetical protein [Latilactobacillus sakei]
MKILHFAEYASGGVATYLRNTLSYQLDSNSVDEVILLNSQYKSEPFKIESKKFKQLCYAYSRSLKGILKLLSLRKIIDNQNPDILHIHSSFAGLLRLSFFLKKPDYKVVYCAHGWSFIQQDKNDFKKKIYALVERVLVRKTDLVINISNNEQRAAIKYGLPEEKMKVVYNSIPDNESDVVFSREYVVTEQHKRRELLFIGRFDKAKGLNFLIQNMNFKDNNVTLTVIGESILNDSKFNEVERAGVVFLGWINNEDINQYISRCDAVIVPSLWEGFGLVALEAMKNKKMVISSDAGGLPELVDDGYNGLLFNSGSAPSLQNAIKKFNKLSQSELDIMGKNGYQRYITKYNFEILSEALLKAYVGLEGE